MFKVGKVVNYYEKVSMAIVELDGLIALGDNIVFVRNGDELFDMKLTKIQKGHTQIESATKGDIVGIPCEKKLAYGTYVYKKS